MKKRGIMLSAIELKEQIQAVDADLVGIAGVDSHLLREYGEEPEKLLPGARSLISIGVALNKTAVCSGNIRLARYDTMCVYERINHVSMETIRILASQGARAVSVPPYLPVDMGGESKGMKGDINHKTVAAIAGLGGIGLSRLLVTPEFGPFVRLGTIITDAVLSPDQPLSENPCDLCGLCKDACPAKAIQEDGTLDYSACTSHILRNGLPGIIAIARKMIGADEKAIKGVIYSPNFWEIWQSTVSGSFYGCFDCLASCPIGFDKSGDAS
jgi:epoxyqueuosine reductase